VAPLTLTATSLPPQPPAFSAAITPRRAASLAAGATASSRSRNTSSAARPRALSRNLWLLPGTARQERRERYSSGTFLRPPACHGTLSYVSQSRPAPPPPPALIAEATKRAGLIWIVIEGQDRPRPAWHVWHPGTGPGAPGAAYVVTGPGEQPLPGLAGAGRVTVMVMGTHASGSQASGGRVAWTAAVTRVEPGSGEWD